MDAEDALLSAFNLVARCLDVPVAATFGDAQQSSADRLEVLARNSRLRTRRVALREGWWRHSCGPMIGFAGEDSHPVALIPSGRGEIEAIDSIKRIRIPVNWENAGELPLFATSFYRSLPDRALSAVDLLKVGWRECRRELGSLILLAIGGSILSAALPIATAKIVNDSIPTAGRSQALQIGIGLAAAMSSATLVRFFSHLVLLTMDGKIDAALQSGIWDRLLNLPAEFFRRYLSGDFADRVMGINRIRRMAMESTASAMLTVMFSLFSIVLLFVYSAPLAIVAVGFVLLMALVAGAASCWKIKHQREISGITGEIDGAAFQILTGMAKLRVARAESRALDRWARLINRQKVLILRSRTITAFANASNSALPAMARVALFAGFVALTRGLLSAGNFLACYAAFGVVAGAGIEFCNALISFAQVVPLYERARPILEAVPEIDLSKRAPGLLSGAVEFSGVCFRYGAAGPPFLQEISFRIAPGEFVALAGASGSGKSTLLRLMLGFEKPEKGMVAYDGQDIGTLDVQAVRRQIGVVLQQGRLISGDIFHNIAGALPLTMDEAWEAARNACLEEDIHQMPMGMFTYLNEGGGNLSGGQRQRLLIARALAGRPKILLLDEATSALDNRTQAIVSRSLERMSVTRVVIAHRLTAIRNATRILVVNGGRLVEMGNYDELMSREGVFAELANRQRL